MPNPFILGCTLLHWSAPRATLQQTREVNGCHEHKGLTYTETRNFNIRSTSADNVVHHENVRRPTYTSRRCMQSSHCNGSTIHPGKQTCPATLTMMCSMFFSCCLNHFARRCCPVLRWFAQRLEQLKVTRRPQNTELVSVGCAHNCAFATTLSARGHSATKCFHERDLSMPTTPRHELSSDLPKYKITMFVVRLVQND